MLMGNEVRPSEGIMNVLRFDMTRTMRKNDLGSE
jgi:hypothetical protein